MIKELNHITAIVMTVVFLLLTVLPLAPLVSESAESDLVAGECSGDCDADGCSLEDRVRHTCCCWQKRQAALGVPAPSTEGRSCCATAAGKNPPASRKASVSADIDADGRQSTTSKTIYKCGCPGGSSKVLAVWQALKLEVVFAALIGIASPPEKCSRYITPSFAFNSRDNEPPEPPPNLLSLS